MGKKIESYLLQQMIGQGEFGKVYRATNQKTNETVAIKIIRIEKFKSTPKLEQFTINQIQTLSKIQDTTHIVRFIQILKTANNYYFVYEYCNGGTLQQQIKRDGALSQPLARTYFKGLLQAFTLLHHCNIMHRDVKPSNILLHNGVIKLADFGFCKPLKDARDLSQTMLGSPIYMAPEVLKGQVYTIKADIWSLGVVLYQMLFGYCPFEEKTIAKLINAIEDQHLVIPNHIPVSREIKNLIQRMLVKDQFKRIDWEELFQYQNEEGNASYSHVHQQKNGVSQQSLFTNSSSIRSNINNNGIVNNNVSAAYPLNVLTNNTTVLNTYPSGFSKKNPVSEECLRQRKKVQRGVLLMRQLLQNNSSRLTISICSILYQKVKSHMRKLHEGLEGGSRLGGLLLEELRQIQDKMAVFDSEKNTDPEDIVFMRFAEEEGMMQEKEGIKTMLIIGDYFNDRDQDYAAIGKKELLQIYQNRIINN